MPATAFTGLKTSFTCCAENEREHWTCTLVHKCYKVKMLCTIGAGGQLTCAVNPLVFLLKAKSYSFPFVQLFDPLTIK